MWSHSGGLHSSPPAGTPRHPHLQKAQDPFLTHSPLVVAHLDQDQCVVNRTAIWVPRDTTGERAIGTHFKLGTVAL